MPVPQSCTGPELYGQHFADRFALSRMYRVLYQEFPRRREIVFFCIGIDRSCGDSFGPLTGTLLRQFCVQNVMGTLESPVHAGNLVRVMDRLHPEAFVVAIDAALGQVTDIGKIYIRRGALQPGTAVRRDLPPVGDLSVVMNVNLGGIANHLFLNHSSLNVVWRGARTVALSIMAVLYRIRKESAAR